MNRILRIGAAVGIALGIRACMIIIDDKLCNYDSIRALSQYSGKSAEQIQKSVSTLKEAQKIAKLIYSSNGQCFQGACLIAHLLKDDGYQQKFVKLSKEGWGVHWFYMQEGNKKEFADNGLFGIKKYKSINDLVKYVEKSEKVKGLKYEVIEKMPSSFDPETIELDMDIRAEYMKRKGI